MEPLAADALKLIGHVAEMDARRFVGWADRDDIYQELFLYYTGNQAKFEKWRLSGEDDESFRLMRALFGEARKYCENEKAIKSGYSYDDIAWYDPALLVNLLPLALNPRWDGLSGADEDPGLPRGKTVASESGTLLAMVCDVRRVLRGKTLKLVDFDPDAPTGQENLEWLSNQLGGPKPAGDVPRRRAISNARAQATTTESY